MPGFIARKLCADLVIVPTDMAKYSAVSRVIRSVLSQYDPNMTPLSLDEAYMDFTDHLVKRRELDDQSRTFPEFSETMCRCEPEERLGVVSSTEGISSAGDISCWLHNYWLAIIQLGYNICNVNVLPTIFVNLIFTKWLSKNILRFCLIF